LGFFEEFSFTKGNEGNEEDKNSLDRDGMVKE
jgi:hypothetical protein